MKRKLVKARFKGLSEQIDTLTDTEYFQTHGETLYDVGRNTVKRFRWEGVDMVVKRFGGISVFNRLMYGTFRESKAMRAYKYASKLRAMHIATPEEIAVAETATAATESIHAESGEEGFTLENVLTDTESEDTMLEKLSLRQSIGELEEREALVIKLRYFHGLTQQRVSKVLGVSQVQVSRIEKKALAKLREMMM